VRVSHEARLERAGGAMGASIVTRREINLQRKKKAINGDTRLDIGQWMGVHNGLVLSPLHDMHIHLEFRITAGNMVIHRLSI